MKRFLCFCLSLLLLLSLCGCGTVNVSGEGEAVLRFVYGDKGISQPLTPEEAGQVASILDHEILLPDSPSCGFDENISISMDGQVFALARDGCGIIQHCDSGRYLFVSDKEISAIHALFARYGGYFPCI